MTGWTKRLCFVHTLQFGLFKLNILDVPGNIFGSMNLYDGCSEALLSVNNKHIFMRELLNSWMNDIHGSGKPFRNLFTSWNSRNKSLTAKLHRIGVEDSADRQWDNHTFSALLTILQFREPKDLYALFLCSRYKQRQQDGSKNINGVVMYGTEVRILGVLPNFKRQIEEIRALQKF